MPDVIGILGGISPASTARYYTRLIQRYHQRKRDYHYPEIALYSLDFQHFTDLEESRNKEAYIQEIVRGCKALQQAGADFALLAANSPHAVLEEVQGQLDIPLVSIVEATAAEAERLNLARVLLLGIASTMQGHFYQDAFKDRSIMVLTPSVPHQAEINAMIFQELVVDLFKDSTRSRLLKLIEQYDVDGVVLGCTELPLLIQQRHLSIPVLDTLNLHVDAALDRALREE